MLCGQTLIFQQYFNIMHDINQSYYNALPVKQSGIYCLSQTVSVNCCTFRIKRSFDDFFRGDHHTLTQCILQSISITPEIGEELERLYHYKRGKRIWIWIMVAYVRKETAHEKLCSHLEMELGFIVFWNWWIYLLSLCEFDVPNVKNCCNNSKNCFLRES